MLSTKPRYMLTQDGRFVRFFRFEDLEGKPELRREMAAALWRARAWRFVRRPARPAAIAKIARCYDYQACEHPAYEASSARAIVAALMARYPESLPGYDDMPWGITGAADLMRAGCVARVDRRGKLA